MARRPAGDGLNQSEFIRRVLNSDPNARHKDINERWKEEGQGGTISASLYYQVKSKLGLAKRGRGRGRPPKSESTSMSFSRPKMAPASVASAPVISTGGHGFLEIEELLDQAIAKAHNLGETSVANAIRLARRQVSAKLVN